jgi:hypothetical protein
MEISMEIALKAKDRTAIFSSDTAPGIYPKEHKSGSSRDTCTSMFITALFTVAKLWKQPRCPTPNAYGLNYTSSPFSLDILGMGS